MARGETWQPTDAELTDLASAFRDGILDGTPSDMMCAAVCWPLAALLRNNGLQCEAVESDLSEELGLLDANHVWIRLADGRALDPTADQFNRWWGSDKYPPVYLGEPTELHVEELAAPGANSEAGTSGNKPGAAGHADIDARTHRGEGPTL